MDDGKDDAAVARAKLGGSSGGPPRAEQLSNEARHQVAIKGASARWKGPLT